MHFPRNTYLHYFPLLQIFLSNFPVSSLVDVLKLYFNLGLEDVSDIDGEDYNDDFDDDINVNELLESGDLSCIFLHFFLDDSLLVCKLMFLIKFDSYFSNFILKFFQSN